MLRRLRGDERFADAALAVVLAVAGLVEALTADLEGGSRVATVAAAVTAAALLAGRRRRPRVVAVAVILTLLLKDAFGGADELIVLLLAGVIAVFTVGSACSLRASLGTVAVLLALTSVAALLAGEPSEVFFSVVAIGAPWLAGRAVRGHGERADLLEELARRREQEVHDRARLAAAEERARIARDLHDMVGHSVSLMTLQAGAAEQTAVSRPDLAAASLASIRETGRETIDELRRLLGLLREGVDDIDLRPVRGVADVESLVGGVRAVGVEVDLHLDGDLARVPDGVGLVAFRILQEALTNVVKHAAPTRARVVVTCSAGRLRVEVADEGPSRSAPNPDGHGLVGMRERAALYGGTLRAGPAAGGGFRVVAELPLGGAG